MSTQSFKISHKIPQTVAALRKEVLLWGLGAHFFIILYIASMTILFIFVSICLLYCQVCSVCLWCKQVIMYCMALWKTMWKCVECYNVKRALLAVAQADCITMQLCTPAPPPVRVDSLGVCYPRGRFTLQSRN